MQPKSTERVKVYWTESLPNHDVVVYLGATFLVPSTSDGWTRRQPLPHLPAGAEPVLPEALGPIIAIGLGVPYV